MLYLPVVEEAAPARFTSSAIPSRFLQGIDGPHCARIATGFRNDFDSAHDEYVGNDSHGEDHAGDDEGVGERVGRADDDPGDDWRGGPHQVVGEIHDAA